MFFNVKLSKSWPPYYSLRRSRDQTEPTTLPDVVGAIQNMWASAKDKHSRWRAQNSRLDGKGNSRLDGECKTVDSMVSAKQ